jgi:ketosteroid isomerase-like protein
MPQATNDARSLVDQLRQAFSTHDLEAFGALLADDVRWGDDEHPRRCKNRSEVLGTFSRLLSDGVDAEITELLTGTDGILCALSMQWPENNQRPGDRSLYHVYLGSDDHIDEIRRYDDRASAADAAGIV